MPVLSAAVPHQVEEFWVEAPPVRACLEVVRHQEASLVEEGPRMPVLSAAVPHQVEEFWVEAPPVRACLEVVRHQEASLVEEGLRMQVLLAAVPHQVEEFWVEVSVPLLQVLQAPVSDPLLLALAALALAVAFLQVLAPALAHLVEHSP